MSPKKKSTQAEQLLEMISPETREAATRLLDDLLASHTTEMEQACFALNHAVDSVFWMNANAEFSYVNETAVNYLGYTREELLTLSVHDIDPDFPADAWPQHWQQLRAKGFKQFESQHKTKDGKVFPVEIYATFICFEDKEYVCASAHDISDRKEAEEQLRTSGENYRLLVDNQTDLVVKVDPDGRFLFASPSYLELFGKTSEELLGKTFLPLVHEDDQAATEEAFLAACQPPYTSLIEQRAMTKNGWRWLTWTDTAVQDEDGTVIAVIGAGRDITEQKRARQELDESRLLLRAVVDTMPGRVFWKDLNSVFMGGNLHFAHDAGLDHPDQLIGKTDFDMCWKDQADHFVADDREVLESGKPKLGIQETQTQSGGNTRWVETNKAPLRDGENRIIGTVGTYSDVTERKQAEKALEESEEKLRGIIENSTNLFYSHTPDHVLTYLSPQVKDILGYEVEEALSRWTALASDHPANERGLQLTQEAIRTGKAQPTYELQLIHKDGHPVWVEVREAPVAEDGKTIAITGSLTDITERKEAEKQLKLSQFAMDHSSLSIFQVDRQGQFHYANQAACRQLGYSPEELQGMQIFDVEAQHVRDESDWTTFWKEIKEKGHVHIPGVHRTKNGRIFPVDITANFLTWADQEYVIGFAQDITERKQAEEQIADLARFPEENSNPVFRVSPEGVLMYRNAACDAFLPELSAQVGEKLHPEWKERILNTNEGDPPAETELQVENKVFSVTIAPILDRGYINVYARDITERKRLREAIEKRVLALTRPLENDDEISFEELFDLKEIQRIQDEFSSAAGIASIITNTDGTPITEPSNFTPLCNDIIRKTETGCANCIKSDASLGRQNPDGPIIQHCLSCGLWEAGTSIEVGDRHIANWVIGQVRDETQTDEKMRTYAREIGADEKSFMNAFYNVPVMPRDQFEAIAQSLHTLARQLSTSAYQNLQQARFIADEKRRTEELRRLSAAIDQSPEAVVITDLDGSIQYVNPAFETVTGYLREEALGENPRILKGGQQDNAYYSNLWKTISSGQIWEGRFVNKRKDGGLYTEEAVISPVRDANGVIASYVAVKRDITEELSREEQFLQSQKMEAVGQLAGGIAHDFNNILQAVLGFSEILLRKLGSDTKEHGHVAEIKKAAKRAANLTKQLMAFSRKLPVNRTVLDLNTTVHETKGLIDILLGESFDSVFNLEPALLPIHADPGQMSQIIMNLAVNARDAMPDGGCLTIATENRTFDAGEIAEVPNAIPGTFVCLSVTDTGSGMSQEVKDHLFEPFFSTKEVGKGTGLGLAVAYGIIKQNKGWINVYSEEGQGTAFKCYLPACEPGGTAEGLRQPEDLSGTRVLLVEDEESVRKMVVKILDSTGYKVEAVSSAEQALTMFEQEEGRFDLLFSDMSLPGQSGLELADTLRKKVSDLPVLLCSAYHDQREQWEKREKLGSKGYHFLLKPFSLAILLEAVNNTLTNES